MLKHHVIVESESAVLAYEADKVGQDIVWYTTSPWLLEKLAFEGKMVHSLEVDVSPELRQALGEASVKFAALLAEDLNHCCEKEFDGLKIGRVLERNIQQSSFLLFYKSYLLLNWYKKYKDKNCKLIVVGTSYLKFCQGFSIRFQATDTLFAYLSQLYKLSDVSIFEHQPEISKTKHVYPADERLKKYEKYMNFLSYGLLGFFSVFWSGLQRRGLIKSMSSCLSFRPNKLVFLLKNCDSVHQCFVPFLTQGARVVNFFEKTGFGRHATQKKLSIRFDKFLYQIESRLSEVFSSLSIDFLPCFFSISQQIKLVLYEVLQYGKSLLPKMERFLKEMNTYGLSPKVVLTNHLTGPAQKLLQQYLQRYGVIFFNFQHGVTAGVDGSHTLIEGRHYSSYGEDFWCCVSPKGLSAHTSELDSKGGVVVGPSNTYRRLPLRVLIAPIIRKKIGILKNKRVVTFLASLSRNNFFTIPTQSDLEYYEVTKKILVDVFPEIEAHCILKLYPLDTPFYADMSSFANCLPISSNTTMMANVNFSMLRTVSDVLILTFGGSTFGYAWSCGVPIIFIEFPGMSLVPETREAMKKAIFWIDGSKNEWVNQVKALLHLPKEQFLRLWERKKASRESVEPLFMYDRSKSLASETVRFVDACCKKSYGKNTLSTNRSI